MSRRQDWRVGEECALLLEESENSIWKRHRAAAYEGMISDKWTLDNTPAHPVLFRVRLDV